MNEQMIELIARAICLKDSRSYDCDDACMASGKCVGKLSPGILEDARAAHSVMAGKVAELTEALTMIADENSWKGYSPAPIVDRMRQLAEFALARAALAPYPERRHE